MSEGPPRGESDGSVPRAADGRPLPRVAIVDDHDLFRAGVRASLGARVEVVADSGGVEDAVRAIEELAPDVVLLDVHMPGGGGVEVIRRVADTCPDVRFLALSVSDAAEDVIALMCALTQNSPLLLMKSPQALAAPVA